MPDVYTSIATAGVDVVGPLIEILELRAADPGQRAMRERYLADLELPPGARVAEVGCGPGPVARAIARLDGVSEVVGVDPSPVFVAAARERGGDVPGLRFVEGDARDLPLDDGDFDAVVFHTTLCHVPEPERALAEALRVLRPGGRLAVFDGDYATATCALGDADPLQACVEAALESLVHDRWFVRRLPALVAAAGFGPALLRGYSYVEAPTSAGYFLRLVERGADALRAGRRVGDEACAALKAEAHRRSAEGTFFGHIAYVSAVARKP